MPRSAVPAPSILLFATLHWPIAARLALAFSGLGCRVAVAGPAQHPALCTRAIRRLHRYSVLRPLASLRAAIAASKPDLVIPCDDDAALHLQRIELGDATGRPDDSLRALVRRSLGNPSACALATERNRFMALAREEQVRIPFTAEVRGPGDLDSWLTRQRFPAVMKLDGSCGGQGVAMVRTFDDAHRTYARMSAPPALPAALVRSFLEREPALALNAMRRVPGGVTLQQFVFGSPANRAVACWQGKVLAGISVEALRTLHATGPATVVKVIEHAEMTESVRRLVHRLGVSGLWGFDFVLNATSGAAYLIEMNPRATPICHLPVGAGRNLCLALGRQLAEIVPQREPVAIGRDIIAMFPGEWHRDAASPYLHTAYHDVPWQEPDLVRDGLKRPWAERGWMARIRARRHARSVTAGPPFTADACGHVPAGEARIANRSIVVQ